MNKIVSVLSGVWLVIALVTISTPGVAESVQYEEGIHYASIEMPLRTRYPNQVEVTEYFSYGCPHCYQFEPLISAWKARLPDNVVFNRTPAVWNPDYKVYAQTYYAAEALDVLEQVHTQVFNAIQSGKRLADATQMASFFGELGVNPEEFAKVYQSFGVRASLAQAEAKGRAYRASGVPTLIVNGKYRVEGKMAGSNANMLKVADYLIARERQQLASSGAGE